MEGLEARDLPSGAGWLMSQAHAGRSLHPRADHTSAQGVAPADRAHAEGQVVDNLPSSSGDPPFPDPAVIARSIDLLYGPNSPTPRVPTPREVKRETFTARWTGTYVIGPPRFSDRFSTIHFYAVSGGSNQFLKGKFQMALFPPADPNATPNPGDPFANQVTGVAALFNQNLLQTGGYAIIDLNSVSAPGSDPSALPTHMTWTFDSVSSAGTYTAPFNDFNQGTGVVDVHYSPDATPQPGTLGSGHFIVSFQGVLNYSQLISDVSKVYN
jgi:hypothetical protein